MFLCSALPLRCRRSEFGTHGKQKNLERGSCINHMSCRSAGSILAVLLSAGSVSLSKFAWEIDLMIHDSVVYFCIPETLGRSLEEIVLWSLLPTQARLNRLTGFHDGRRHPDKKVDQVPLWRRPRRVWSRRIPQFCKASEDDQRKFRIQRDC